MNNLKLHFFVFVMSPLCFRLRHICVTFQVYVEHIYGVFVCFSLWLEYALYINP
jgi:hypothetical protein